MVKRVLLAVYSPLPVMSDENVVALIVECDDTPSTERRRRRKHAREHTADGVAETRVEIVQYHFGIVG
jgi:hypothetical protein